MKRAHRNGPASMSKRIEQGKGLMYTLGRGTTKDDGSHSLVGIPRALREGIGISLGTGVD
jgi:hypothetical protein